MHLWHQVDAISNFSWLQTYLLERLCFSSDDSHSAYRRRRRSSDTTDHYQLLVYSRHRRRLPRYYIYTHISRGHHKTYTM